MKTKQFKRKEQGRTDYKKRLILLKSKKLRLVIRKSLNNILIQIVQYNPDGDKILISTHSNQLKKFNWSYHRGNIPSAYLTGLLCGTKAKSKKINEAVLDTGLLRNIKKTTIYAALKGVIDAGLKVPVSEDVFPPEERISGKHIVEYGKTKQSSDTQKIFQSTKEKILKQNE